MTNSNSTHLMGRCVNNWDTFYKSNYSWLYKSLLKCTKNSLSAKSIAERILTNLVLTHPEIIANNDVRACKIFVSVIFPYIGVQVERSKKLSAGRLLHIFYHPN